MIRLLALLSVTFAAIGCSPMHPTSYTVYLDPSLGHQATAIVIQAMGEWEEATGVHFDARVQHVSNLSDAEIGVWGVASDAELHEECPHPRALDCTHTDWMPGDSTAGVYIDTRATPLLIHLAALHELGHALGLAHDADGTVMCWHESCESKWITKADVAQYWSLRR